MLYFLWTCPRSMSTLAERLAMNTCIQCIHEPFSLGYYFGQNCVSKRYSPSAEQREQHDYHKILARLMSLPTDQDYFVKDMASHFAQSMAFQDEQYRQFIASQRHAYLVRHPEKSVRSLYQLSLSELTGWDYFEPAECGYADLRQLHNLFGGPVLASEQIASNSEAFMARLCEFIQIPYDPKYLHFEALLDHIPEDWLAWKEWHLDVLNSTGIIPRLAAADTAKPETIDPPELAAALQACLPDYQQLCKFMPAP